MSENSVTLEVVGKPAQDGKFMEVEDFWIARLQSIENQYDEHVHNLERKLLDQRRNTRLLNAVRQHNDRLQGQVTECTETVQGLSRKLGTLQANLKETGRQKTQLESKLTDAKETAKIAKEELQKTLGETKLAFRQRAFLNERLAQAEDEKRKLRTAVRDLESDLGRTRDQIQDTEHKEAVLSKALVRAEAEKQKLGTQNQRSSQTVRYFLAERENDDERIYRIKAELEQVLDQLGKERLVGLEIFRQHQKGQKQLRESKKDLSEVISKMDQNSFETLNWKQEAAMLKKLIRTQPESRNDRGRGRVAQLKQRVLQLERKMDDMEKERKRTDSEVKNLKVLHESLTKIQHQNHATRKRLQPNKPNPQNIGRFTRKCKTHENSMSAKQVQTLQTKVQGLEKELNGCKSKLSVMRLELSGKLGLEKELRWTEKALLQAEANNIKISDTAKTSSQQLGGNQASQALLKQKLMTQISTIHRLWDSAPKLKEKVEKKDGQKESGIRTQEQLAADMARVRTELALAERRQAVFNALQETAEASKLATAARLKEEAEEEDEDERPEVWQDLDTEDLLTSEADFMSSSSSSATSSAKDGHRKKSGGEEHEDESPPPEERGDEVGSQHKEEKQLLPIAEAETEKAVQLD